MRLVRLLALGFAAGCLIGACGGGGDDTDPTGNGDGDGDGDNNEGPLAFLPLYESGSRLRAITHGSPDSEERVFVTWYDSEIDSECAFQRASDGEIRCLPRGQHLTIGYRDEACTQVVYYDGLVNPCEEHQLFRLEQVGESTCDGWRVISMREVTDVSMLYHESCDGEASWTEGALHYEDDEELEPEMFVRAESVERSNSDGIGVVEWRGDDGSRQVAGMFDAERGPCSARRLDGADLRCTPAVAYLDAEWWFSGEDCSGEQLAYDTLVSECVEPVEFALVLDLEDGSRQLVTLGEPVAGTVWEQDIVDATCSEQDTSDILWSLYPVLDAYDETLLPALERENRGDQRAQVGHFTVDGTVLTVDAHLSVPFYDTERQVECSAVHREGGDWVCVDDQVSGTETLYYADSDCTEPVLLHTEVPTDVVVHWRQNHCGRESFGYQIFGVFTVGASYDAEVYSITDESCSLYSGGGEPGFFTLIQAPDELAPLTETVD